MWYKFSEESAIIGKRLWFFLKQDLVWNDRFCRVEQYYRIIDDVFGTIEKIRLCSKKTNFGVFPGVGFGSGQNAPPTVCNFLPCKISKEAVKIALQRTFAGL